MELKIQTAQTILPLPTVLALRLRADEMTPYTTLSATAALPEDIDPAAVSAAVRILLTHDGVTLHCGTPDHLEGVVSGTGRLLRLSSKGCSAMLLQNQIEPGVYTDMTLPRLMTEFFTLPDVTWEDSSRRVNYIYIRENASLWEAVSHLGYKTYSTLPFVRGANEVRLTLPADIRTFAFSSGTLLERGMIYTTERMYSDFDMADADGVYGNYTYHDARADGLRIVRTRTFGFDEQYLSSPMQALTYRARVAGQGVTRHFLTAARAYGIRVGDRVVIDEMYPATVRAVQITGGHSGIRTKVEF